MSEDANKRVLNAFQVGILKDMVKAAAEKKPISNPIGKMTTEILRNANKQIAEYMAATGK